MVHQLAIPLVTQSHQLTYIRPTVRIAPNTLSFTSEKALNDIYGPNRLNVCKSDWYITADSATGTLSTFSEVDKQKHGMKRRFLAPAFSESSLRAAEDTIIRNVRKFCELLRPNSRTEWSEKEDMAVLMSWLGLDIMGEIAYSKNFDCLEGKTGDENRKLAGSTVGAAHYVYWVSYLPFASTIVQPLMKTKLMEIVGGTAARDNIRMVNNVIAHLEERLRDEEAAQASGQYIKDFMYFLLRGLKEKDGGKTPRFEPTREDLYAESLSLINAGVDPFSSTMAAALFYLLHNPFALEKATRELRTTFTSSDDIRGNPKLNGCSYLHGVIEESLRLAPPVPSPLPRTVMKGGHIIDGAYYPQGTVVGVAPYVIHHNEAYFPDPWAFRPERWIPGTEGTSAGSLELAKRAFCPFSKGIRGCIGKNVAYLEFRLTLAHVLWELDLRLAPGFEWVGEGGERLGVVGRERKDEYQLEDCMAAGRKGPWVQFKERSASMVGELKA